MLAYAQRSLVLLLIWTAALYAQSTVTPLMDSSVQLNPAGSTAFLDAGAARSAPADTILDLYFTDDSTKYNKYGDLLNDNPLYNPTVPFWMCALGVTGTNAATWAIDRYAFNYDWARVGPDTWKQNFQTGWVWDGDRFGMNYFFHPFSGGMFYNVARSNGHTFLESAPFALLGSLEWEYFAENTLPSYNDLINTPVNGIFIGEILYRLGSNILDDQTSGASRFFREFVVAIMTPTRFFSRLVHGNLARSTTEEIYQKEPMNIMLAGGYHRVNKGTSFKEVESNSVNFNIHLDYGNPFENRSRKPFDYFKVRTDFDFGTGRKILDNITGYGILFGRNVQMKNADLLVGAFQHMNFFDNNTFELGTIAFGPGLISKITPNRSSSVYTNVHVGIVPFSGLSGRFGPDTTQTRDYNYGGGMEMKLECTYNVSGVVGVTFIGYYWWLYSFVGTVGNNSIALVKPRIIFKLFNNVSIGFEHLMYYSDRYPRDYPAVHSVRTEQKIFLQMFLEEFKIKR